MSKSRVKEPPPISVDSHGPRTRLRDIISGMRSRHGACFDLIARVDPAVADMLRALAAHRQIAMEDFVVETLMCFALDAADAAWENGLRQFAPYHDDPEAALLSRFLERAIGLRVRAERMIVSGAPADRTPIRPQRVGHPYAPE